PPGAGAPVSPTDGRQPKLSLISIIIHGVRSRRRLAWRRLRREGQTMLKEALARSIPRVILTRSALSLLLGVSLVQGAREGTCDSNPFPDRNPGPGTLKQVPVPEPTDLSVYVKNRSAAIAMGKALFWDMQVGSDGVQACASCHFRAGADPRSINQANP